MNNTQMVSLEETKEKYLPLWLADSYSPEDARIALDKIFEQTKTAVAGCQNQIDFHAKIKNSIDSNPNKISPDKPISLLPGLIEVAPFEIDIRKLLLTVMSHDGSWGRTKPAMRFLELWNEQVTRSERAYIIKRLIETDEAGAAFPLALYSEKIINLFSDDPELINDIFSFIESHFQILPILSAISKMPVRFRWKLEKWLPQENPVKTDHVIGVRHVNNFAGTCTWMAGSHYATLIDETIDQAIYGDVTLLYVDNILIGSMKMYRNRSILGLRTLQDSRGCYPMITGGVYVTTTEITIQAEQAFKKQGKWTKLHLERLPLLPLELIWSEDGSDMFQGTVRDLQSLRESLLCRTGS
jgi:hypothetical protein